MSTKAISMLPAATWMRDYRGEWLRIDIVAGLTATAYDPRVVVLDCSGIPDVAYTALTMLTEADQNLRARGITLWLAGINPDLLRVIERSPLGDALSHERMFFDLFHALDAYRQQGGTPG